MFGVALLMLGVFSGCANGEIIGAITALAPLDLPDLNYWPLIDSVTSAITSENNELHTWTHFINYGQGAYKMRLEQSFIGANYVVILYFDNLILDKAQASRFDGELTKSVSVLSSPKDFHPPTVIHTLNYLQPEHTCVERRYFTKKVNGVWVLEKKEEDSCIFPEATITATFRKNYWCWSDKPFSSWSLKIRGFWGGSVVRLPEKSGEVAEFLRGKQVLHTWKNSLAKNYKLHLMRVVDQNNKAHFYVETRYKDIVLDSGILVNRFDDDLLDSILVSPFQTLDPNTGRPIEQTDNYSVAYKMTTGYCYVRTYNIVRDQLGNPLKKVTLVKQQECRFFTVQNYLNKFLSQPTQNGWMY